MTPATDVFIDVVDFRVRQRGIYVACGNVCDGAGGLNARYSPATAESLSTAHLRCSEESLAFNRMKRSA